ncbi:MAG: hypothetical protein AAGD25_40585 [Cyanobacteria bacterium P01_F01_bin.150]
MAAAITTTATTLEGQILECVNTANTQESALSDDLNQGLFNVAVDPEGGTVTVTATLNASFVSNGNKLEVTALPYLP